jgi:uncharacterized membrane protein
MLMLVWMKMSEEVLDVVVVVVVMVVVVVGVAWIWVRLNAAEDNMLEVRSLALLVVEKGCGGCMMMMV